MVIRILSVAYDPMLGQTREWILKKAGYDVVSAGSLTSAVAACKKKYDLVLLGYLVRPDDVRTIISTLRESGCSAPVLAISPLGHCPLQEVTEAVEPEPHQLLETVASLVGPPKRKSASG